MVRKTYKVHDIVIPQANDPTKTISKTVYEAEDHHAEDGMIGFEAPDATLVTNVLTPVDTVVVVRGEGAAADTIDHIIFGSVPDIKDKDLLWLVQGAEAITINHNTATPPADSGPVLLLSQVPKKMIGTRMVLLQRQGSNFQEIAFDGIVGDGGILVEDDEGNAIIVCGSVASAVNHLKVTNAATGNDVIVEVIGADTNIGITTTPKGTGLIKGNIETILLPLGDESTPPTSTGVKYTFFMQRAGKFVGAGFANATVAPTTSALILDIHLEGTTIFSTLPEIAATQNQGSNGVLTSDPTTFAAADKIELLIDTIDSGATGAGAKVGISFYYT